MDKRVLLEGLVDALKQEREVLARAANAAREGATNEESRPENDKDTRAIEAGYLAGAQAQRVREVDAAIATLSAVKVRSFGPGDAVSASALVTLECDGARAVYFLLPEGGGMRARAEGLDVVVLTLRSPLGRALVGRTTGDVVEIEAQGRLREYEIVDLL